jgi:hypothetical protein
MESRARGCMVSASPGTQRPHQRGPELHERVPGYIAVRRGSPVRVKAYDRVRPRACDPDKCQFKYTRAAALLSALAGFMFACLVVLFTLLVIRWLR